MDYIQYIKNPERLDAEAVERLRQIVEQNPYFHAARLLYVRGLYQMQSDAFGPELRKAAILLPDRTQLFDLLEGYKYRLEPERRRSRVRQEAEPQMDRTFSLIDSFLAQAGKPQQPVVVQPVDATVDYMAYLMQMEDIQPEENGGGDAEESRTDRIITDFMEDRGGRILLSGDNDDDADGTITTNKPEASAATIANDDSGTLEDDYFTETLARIYIKQGKYSKAIEIIKRLNLMVPKKNAYFADQIRFLEKLEFNSRFRKEDIKA